MVNSPENRVCELVRPVDSVGQPSPFIAGAKPAYDSSVDTLVLAVPKIGVCCNINMSLRPILDMIYMGKPEGTYDELAYISITNHFDA